MRPSLALLGLLTLSAGAQAGDGPDAASPGRDDPLLAYVATYEPLDADIRQRVLDAVALPDAAASEKKLVALGEPARRVLLSLAVTRPNVEKRARAVLDRLDSVHAEVARRGLDHDIGWLAAAGAIGTERLARILPASAPRKNAVEWWTLHSSAYRWDPTGDRYVPATSSGTSLRLRDRATVRLEKSANLVGPGRPFTLELSWRSEDAATELYLAGDEGWPENPPGGKPTDTKVGWVLRRIPAGKGAAYLQFCAAIAPNHWWAISSAPMSVSRQWEHLALLCTNDTVRVYRNGECVAAGRCDELKFLPSPVDLCIGPRENTPDNNAAWARRVGHHDLRAVRLSEGGRFKEDFVAPDVLEMDGATLALLEFKRGATELTDLSGHGHPGTNLGGRWTSHLDLDDARTALAALGGKLGAATFVEAECGAGSADWWVNERDGMSDGFIREVWSDRDEGPLGHWVKVPFQVEKAGAYRVWFLGGNLERRVGEEPFDYSPFSWRVDEAPAQRVAGGAPTVAGTRIERGLSPLGVVDLAAGEHVFDLRLSARRAIDEHWSLWFDGLVLERVE